ncbi:hypothetical protein D9M68_966880 [compost metagenome]
MAGEADARVEDAPVQQHGQAHETDHAGGAARVDGQALLDRGVQEAFVEKMRREQSHRVAEKQEQDADVEQVAAPAQLALAQQLRGIAFPGVLVPVEAGQAAHEEDR